jgi:hypothetical protein
VGGAVGLGRGRRGPLHERLDLPEDRIGLPVSGPGVARDGGRGGPGGVVEAEDSKQMVLEGVGGRRGRGGRCAHGVARCARVWRAPGTFRD